MLEQGVPLEDDADAALARREVRHVSAAEEDAPAGGVLEAADQPQKGGLARARGAHQGRQPVGRDLEVEARGADERLAAGAQRVVALVELLDADADAVFGDDDPASGSGSGS